MSAISDMWSKEWWAKAWRELGYHRIPEDIEDLDLDWQGKRDAKKAGEGLLTVKADAAKLLIEFLVKTAREEGRQEERTRNQNAVNALYSLKVRESSLIPKGQVWVRKGTLQGPGTPTPREWSAAHPVEERNTLLDEQDSHRNIITGEDEE
jgi:hypothetical protein